MHMEKSFKKFKNWPKMTTLNSQMEKKCVKFNNTILAHFKTHTCRLPIHLQISDHRLQLLVRS